MPLVQIVSYLAVLVAALAILIKAYRYATAPVHFRWELYPVPHEKGRGEYGGSYLEELDWWTKPRHNDRIAELREMMLEIILMKGVFRHNKKVWVFSFPFHFGLYLLIGWAFLLLLGGILQLAGVTVGNDAGASGSSVHYFTIICGYAGFALAGLGALGLLIWRLTDENQKAYNSPAEYFNLVLFDLVIVVALISQLTLDPAFVSMRQYAQALVTFTPAVTPDGWFTAEILLLSLIVMYVPLSRMSHFVSKYFLYHAVRWNDEPNARGSAIEKKIMEMLQQKVGWSASHIQTGKPWIDVVKETKNE